MWYKSQNPSSIIFGAFTHPDGIKFFGKFSVDIFDLTKNIAIDINNCTIHGCLLETCPTNSKLEDHEKFLPNGLSFQEENQRLDVS